jgi:hypothetical protein
MSTFSIPFPEYDIANILQKEFPKRDNFSVAIPLSRQQKFYDLLLVNGESKKSLTIQVKSSRTYLGREKDEYQYYSWLNYFDIKDNYSDFYFIYMTYPLFDKNFTPRAKWDRKILVFNQKEMINLLANVKTKAGKQERFFSFGFNSDNDKIYGARGFAHLDREEFSKNLLESKLDEVKNKLNK